MESRLHTAQKWVVSGKAHIFTPSPSSKLQRCEWPQSPPNTIPSSTRSLNRKTLYSHLFYRALTFTKGRLSSLHSIPLRFHLFSTSSQNFRRKPGRRPTHTGIDPDELREIVELIIRNAPDTISKLDDMNFELSCDLISEILRVLSDHRAPALRFFNWVLNFYPSFNPNAAIYNQIIDNLGRVDDYSSMALVLNDLSPKGHCLTEKAFAFLRGHDEVSIKDSTRRVLAVLNEVGGSCRGSGIHSLLKFFSALNRFDLAAFLMEETTRCTSYYNVIIAAMCKNGQFQDARKVFGEMTRFGCEPNTVSYNYLLGGLFKTKRFAEGCELLQKMEEEGLYPNPVTFEVVAYHACKDNRMDFALEFLDQMVSQGIKPRITMHAAFIKGFFCSGRADDAYKYAVDMSTRDQCSSNMNYSIVARLYQLSGRVVEAGRVLCEMMEKGFKPNFPVYIKVVKELHMMDRGDMALQLKALYAKFCLGADIG